MTYCEVFDAYFDEHRKWTSKKCEGPERCSYCDGRPELHPFDCRCLDEHEVGYTEDDY